MSKSTKGFSLLELLIVVTIILTIAMIAVPRYQESVKTTNETSAVVELKTLYLGQLMYQAKNGRFGAIPELIGANVLDPRFAETVSGYKFTVKLSDDGSYVAEAVPATPRSGRYAFSIDDDGLIRHSTDPELAPEGRQGMVVGLSPKKKADEK